MFSMSICELLPRYQPLGLPRLLFSYWLQLVFGLNCKIFDADT